MKYRTMNRKELASELGYSKSTLGRRMKKLPLEFREAIAQRLLYEHEVKYIHEKLTEMKIQESGSK
ncbi:MAG: hypothetical protein ACERIH_03370 [Labilibaculum antarcticum]